jgi:Spy/CpxP family protein refolding chaperone
MKHLTTIGILTTALTSGFITFLYARNPETQAVDQTRPPMSHLLELSTEQERVIDKADPNFPVDAGALAAKLDAEQENLATLLEDPNSEREATMAQVETMMIAHNNLERRVAEHVLEVREHLTPEQRKKLMGLMAQRVRVTQNRMQRCRWGWGRGQGRGGRGGNGSGRGGGRRSQDNDPTGQHDGESE